MQAQPRPVTADPPSSASPSRALPEKTVPNTSETMTVKATGMTIEKMKKTLRQPSLSSLPKARPPD